MIFSPEIDWLGAAATPLLAVGLLVFCALFIVALIRAPADSPEQPGVHLRTPRETLDEHLTKGEITREEYVDRRKALDFKAVIV
jgi:uncharacterized membrane protein